MADLKISQLSSATALAGTEVVPVVQGGSTKKATIDQILAPASGKGIDFSAAGGDTLKMYDEGTWTPTVTASGGGSFTTVSATGQYTRVGRLVQFTLTIVITNAGTATGAVVATLPFSAATADSAVMGRETNATGFSLQGTILNGYATMSIQKYDNTSIIANGRTLTMTGTYTL